MRAARPVAQTEWSGYPNRSRSSTTAGIRLSLTDSNSVYAYNYLFIMYLLRFLPVRNSLQFTFEMCSEHRHADVGSQAQLRERPLVSKIDAAGNPDLLFSIIESYLTRGA